MRHWTRPLSGRVANAPAAMGSRWRFVLFQPSHLVRNAQGTARGRRMPSSRGTLPRSESSRQQGVSHGKVAGRPRGAPLRVEKRAFHELFGGMHSDLLTSNQETRPSQTCADTFYYCGTWRSGETAQWTASTGQCRWSTHRRSLKVACDVARRRKQSA